MNSLTNKTQMDIRCAADIIMGSKYSVVLTGAGVSTPSGIPDFRSSDGGLWTKYDPFEVASLSTFRYNPKKFYNWIRPFAVQIRDAQPNRAHVGFAHLEETGHIKSIITQNIDCLHQRAGSKNVIEVHGSWESMSCTDCFRSFSSQGHIEPFLSEGTIPCCPDCGSVLKPDLVLVGESLPARNWMQAIEASKTCDLMIIVGSSLEIMPVAGLPMRALENGARLIVINHSETCIDMRADVVLHEDVAEVIPLIVGKILGD
ncbi:NAD-dependent deacetylase [Chloroflexota bacterium]